ncbi:MAG: mechanosensitive ion channel family protein [Pseudomonadota bacterium]
MQETNPNQAVTDARAGLEKLMNPETIASLTETALGWAITALGALTVLVIGLWIAGRLKKITISAVNRAPNLDETLSRFFGSIVYYIVVAFVVIAVLSMFGIQTTGLAALIGAAGLAIGLALQGTLGHVASGVMLLAFRPFKIGDWIEAAGEAGTVNEISLFTTILNTPDNKRIIIPNGDIYDGAITNYSAYATRRVDFVMGISYEDDINKAMAAFQSEIDAHEKTHDTPAPQIVVSNLGDSSVDITIRVWCNTADYWAVNFDLTKAFKERLDKEGINIPYPTRTVYQQQPAS